MQFRPRDTIRLDCSACNIIMFWPAKRPKRSFPVQCCQLSRETSDFGPFFPVSRLEFEISSIIAEVCRFFSRLRLLSDHKISTILRCLSYFNVHIKLNVSSGIWWEVSQWGHMLRDKNIFLARFVSSQIHEDGTVFSVQMTSCAVRYDVIYHPSPINSQFKVDRLQIVVVAKKYITTCRNRSSVGCLKCVQFHNWFHRLLVSAPLNPAIFEIRNGEWEWEWEWE